MGNENSTPANRAAANNSWTTDEQKKAAKQEKQQKKQSKIPDGQKKAKFGFRSKKSDGPTEISAADDIGPESPASKSKGRAPPPPSDWPEPHGSSGAGSSRMAGASADGMATGMPVTVDLNSGRVTAGVADSPFRKGSGGGMSARGETPPLPAPSPPRTGWGEEANEGWGPTGGGGGTEEALALADGADRPSTAGSRPSTAGSHRPPLHPSGPSPGPPPQTPPSAGDLALALPLPPAPRSARGGSSENGGGSDGSGSLALMAHGRPGGGGGGDAEETPRMEIVPRSGNTGPGSSRPGTALSQYSVVQSVYSDGRPKSAHALRLRELVQNKEELEEIVDTIFEPQGRHMAAEKAAELREELQLLQVSIQLQNSKHSLDGSVREVLRRELKETEAVRVAEDKARAALLELEEEAAGARRKAAQEEADEKERAALARKRVTNVLNVEIKRLDAERAAAHESARIEFDRLDAIKAAEEGRAQSEIARIEADSGHTVDERKSKLAREAQERRAHLSEQMERARAIWKEESAERNRHEEAARKAVAEAEGTLSERSKALELQEERKAEVLARAEGLRSTMAEAQQVLDSEETGQQAAHRARDEEAAAETRLLEKEAMSVAKHLEDLRAAQDKEHHAIHKRIERLNTDWSGRKEAYRRKRKELTELLEEEDSEGLGRTDQMHKAAVAAEGAVDQQRQKMRRLARDAQRAGSDAGIAWREEKAALEDQMADLAVEAVQGEAAKWAEVEATRAALDEGLRLRREQLAAYEADLGAAAAKREGEIDAVRSSAEAVEERMAEERAEHERAHGEAVAALEEDRSDFERRTEERSEALAARMQQERDLLAQEAAARAKKILTRDELEDKRARHESSKQASVSTVGLLEAEVGRLEKKVEVAGAEAAAAGEKRDKRYAGQEADLKAAEEKITGQVAMEAKVRVEMLGKELEQVSEKRARNKVRLGEADEAEARGKEKVDKVRAKHREVVSVLQAQVENFGSEKRRRQAELQAQWKALEAEETKAAHQLVDMETNSQESLRRESERLQQVTEERKVRVQRLKAQVEANAARRAQEEGKAQAMLTALRTKITQQKAAMIATRDDLTDKRDRHEAEIRSLEAGADDSREAELALLELKAGTRSMEMGLVPLELQLPIAALQAEQDRLEEECRQRGEDEVLDGRRVQREEEAMARELQERARALQEMTERERYKIEAEREDRRLRSDMRRRALEQRAAAYAERDREATLKLEVMTASASDLAASVQLEESRVAMERGLRETEAREEEAALDAQEAAARESIAGAPEWEAERFKERCDEMYADWRAKWEKTDVFKAADRLEKKHAALTGEMDAKKAEIVSTEEKMAELEMEWELLLENQDRLRAGGTAAPDPQTLWQQQAQAEGEAAEWARIEADRAEFGAACDERERGIERGEAEFLAAERELQTQVDEIRARLPPLEAEHARLLAEADASMAKGRTKVAESEHECTSAKKAMEQALRDVGASFERQKSDLQLRIDARRAEIKGAHDKRVAEVEAARAELLRLQHAFSEASGVLAKERRRVEMLKGDRESQLGKLTAQMDADEVETTKKEADLERKLAEAVAAAREAYEVEALKQQQRVEHQTEKLAARHSRREKEAADAVEKLMAAQTAAKEIGEVLSEAEARLRTEQEAEDRCREVAGDAEGDLKRAKLELKRTENVLDIERRQTEAEQAAYEEDRRLEMESIGTTLAHQLEGVEKELGRRVEAFKSQNVDSVKHNLSKLARERSRVETERDRELAELDAREVVARQEMETALTELDASVTHRQKATAQAEEVVRERGLREVKLLAERMEKQRRRYVKDMEELWQKMDDSKARLEKAGEQEVLDKERREEEERLRRVHDMEAKLEAERRAIEEAERAEEMERMRQAEERRQARAQLDALARQMEMQRTMQERREMEEMQAQEMRAEEKRRNLRRLQDLQDNFERARHELDRQHQQRQTDHYHRLQMIDRAGPGSALSTPDTRRPASSTAYRSQQMGGNYSGGGGAGGGLGGAGAAPAAGSRPWSAMSMPTGAVADARTRQLWEQHEAEKARLQDELDAIQREREALQYGAGAGLPGAPPSPPGAPQVGGWLPGAPDDTEGGDMFGGGGGLMGERSGNSVHSNYSGYNFSRPGSALSGGAYSGGGGGGYGGSSMSGGGGGYRGGGVHQRPSSAVGSSRPQSAASAAAAEAKKQAYLQRMLDEQRAFEDEKRKMQAEMASLEAEMSSLSSHGGI